MFPLSEYLYAFPESETGGSVQQLFFGGLFPAGAVFLVGEVDLQVGLVFVVYEIDLLVRPTFFVREIPDTLVLALFRPIILVGFIDCQICLVSSHGQLKVNEILPVMQALFVQGMVPANEGFIRLASAGSGLSPGRGPRSL